MNLAKQLSWSIALFGTVALVPSGKLIAQQEHRRPDRQTPRVMVIAAFDDSVPELAVSIVSAAHERVEQLVSPHRLWLVTKRDIDNSLQTEWTPKLLRDYGELAKLVRAEGAVVLTAHGRRDSLDVIGSIVPARNQPIDTVHFQASSPTAAVDSLVSRLLADPRFRRGAT